MQSNLPTLRYIFRSHERDLDEARPSESPRHQKLPSGIKEIPDAENMCLSLSYSVYVNEFFMNLSKNNTQVQP